MTLLDQELHDGWNVCSTGTPNGALGESILDYNLSSTLRPAYRISKGTYSLTLWAPHTDTQIYHATVLKTK